MCIRDRLFYEVLQIRSLSDSIGASEEEVTNAVNGTENDRFLLATKQSLSQLDVGDGSSDWGAAWKWRDGIRSQLDDLASWGPKMAPLARGITTASALGEYGASLTSGNVFGCCWKLW